MTASAQEGALQNLATVLGEAQAILHQHDRAELASENMQRIWESWVKRVGIEEASKALFDACKAARQKNRTYPSAHELARHYHLYGYKKPKT